MSAPAPGPVPAAPARASDADERVRRLRHACGCTTGMVVMLLAIAGYVVHEVRTSSEASTLTQILTGAAIGLAGAVVGKVAGILWARVRLARLLRDASRDGA